MMFWPSLSSIILLVLDKLSIAHGFSLSDKLFRYQIKLRGKVCSSLSNNHDTFVNEYFESNGFDPSRLDDATGRQNSQTEKSTSEASNLFIEEEEPSQIEFVPLTELKNEYLLRIEKEDKEVGGDECLLINSDADERISCMIKSQLSLPSEIDGNYDSKVAKSPFVHLLRGSAMYIASHRRQVSVMHIPGELIMNNPNNNKSEHDFFTNLMDDIALSWLLGIKIVIVIGSRFDFDDNSGSSVTSANNMGKYKFAHEYHNALRVIDSETLRRIQEDIGSLRFDIESQLNRCLRVNGGLLQPQSELKGGGNVISGNFYVSNLIGTVNEIDYQCTGYPNVVHTGKILNVLDKNDILLLTPVGSTKKGEMVVVNSNHLAAFVAASLQASKLIYFSNFYNPEQEQDTMAVSIDPSSTRNYVTGIERRYGDDGVVLRSIITKQHLQDVSLSCARSLLEYHSVNVHGAGFVTYRQETEEGTEEQKQSLDPNALEKLIQLGWSIWGLERGVQRAHIVTPRDGALLEELFTATDGFNTCIRQDGDSDDLDFAWAYTEE